MVAPHKPGPHGAQSAFLKIIKLTNFPLEEECTEEWGIPKEKILMIITDNGINMV